MIMYLENALLGLILGTVLKETCTFLVFCLIPMAGITYHRIKYCTCIEKLPNFHVIKRKLARDDDNHNDWI